MNEQLLDQCPPDELLQDDFAQFLADFVEDPLISLPDTILPAPSVDFGCDDLVPTLSHSSVGALASAASAQELGRSPQAAILNGLQTPVDPKLEKLRAKNRRGQARYREKCKKQRQELEHNIQDRQSRLSHMLTEARRLRNTRSALLGRINAAVPAPTPRPIPPSLPTFAPIVRSTVRRYSIFDDALTPPRPPAAFPHCCPISYADVAMHMPPGPPRSPCDPHSVTEALQSFLRATSDRLACHPSDICFLVQLPFNVPPAAAPSAAASAPAPRPLSHSAGVTSAPCCLSMTVAYLAISVEATFLVREYELFLEGSAGAGVSAETGAACAPPSRAAEEEAQRVAPLPDAAACRHLVLRCGLAETCPLHDAIAALLPPLLRRYRASLPHAVWRRVCVQAIRVVQGTLDDITAKAAGGSTGEETQAGASGCSSTPEQTLAPAAEPPVEEPHARETEGAEMCWAQLDVAMKVAMEVLLHFLTAALHEPPPQEATARHTAGETRQCIFDLLITPSISWRLLFQFAPVAVRRMFMSEHELAASPVQMQRLQNKVFRYLQLTAAQKAEFAARWRCWFRRRFSLDRDFGAALARLHAALPSADDIPLPLLRALSSICDGHNGHGSSCSGSDSAGWCNPAAASAEGSTGSTPVPHTPTLQPIAGAFKPPHSVGGSCSTDTGEVSGARGLAMSGGGRGEAEALETCSSGNSCCVRRGLAISSVISHPVPVPTLYEDDGAGAAADVQACGLAPQPARKSSRGGGAAGAVVDGGEAAVRLLGAAGGVLEEVEDAVEQVAHVHEMDSHMHHEFVSLTTMPAWVLTEIQEAKMIAAYLELGVSSIDLLCMFQVAASELRWEVLSGR